MSLDFENNFSLYCFTEFLDLKMRLWIRNLVTRCITIAQTLMVCIIGESLGAARHIIIASVLKDLSRTPRKKKKTEKEKEITFTTRMNIDSVS